jgi:hypothetical protein
MTGLKSHFFLRPISTMSRNMCPAYTEPTLQQTRIARIVKIRFQQNLLATTFCRIPHQKLQD